MSTIAFGFCETRHRTAVSIWQVPRAAEEFLCPAPEWGDCPARVSELEHDIVSREVAEVAEKNGLVRIKLRIVLEPLGPYRLHDVSWKD